MPVNPTQMRNQLRAWRAAMPNELAQDRATQLAAHLTPWLVAHDAATIGTYVAIRGELDLRPTLQHRSLSTRRQAVPLLAGDRLTFGVITETTTWRTNQYGIAEPEQPELVDLDALDVALVPCVALDRFGNRLGQGAGWYDRTFGAPGRSTILIGIAYEEQLVDLLATNPWDVPMDWIATPAGVRPVDRPLPA